MHAVDGCGPMSACTSLPVHTNHHIHAHMCRLRHGRSEVITSHSICWYPAQLLWQWHAHAASAAAALQQLWKDLISPYHAAGWAAQVAAAQRLLPGPATAA